MNSTAAAALDPGTSDGQRAETLPLRRVELAGVVAFWIFFAVLTLATTMLEPRGGVRPGGLPHGTATRLFVNPAVWAGITMLGLWLSARFPPTGASWRRLVLLVGLGVLIANVADLVADATWDAIVQPSVAPGARGGGERRFRPGLGNLTWLDDLGVYLAALGVGAARGYVLRNRARRSAARRRETELEAESARHQADAAQLHAKLAEARLDALRRQLDPHFLFNTLNSVSALVERDPRGVRRMIGQLSDLLRHSMDDAAAPEIPLRQELAILERYVDIMRVRFADQLAVETRVDPQALDALVPNMLLQPLVENAIKHGVEQRADGGRVEIDVALDGSALVVRVLDNGPGMRTRSLSMPAEEGAMDAASDGRVGVGLRNTAARLAQLYGADYSLTLGPGADGGTMAEVRMPFRTRGGDAAATALRSARPTDAVDPIEATRGAVVRVD